MIKAIKIAEFLGAELYGNDLTIESCSSLNSIRPNAVLFVVKYSDKIRNILNESEEILAIVSLDYDSRLSCSHILVEKPRVAFSRVLENFFVKKSAFNMMSDTAIIGSNVNMGAECRYR